MSESQQSQQTTQTITFTVERSRPSVNLTLLNFREVKTGERENGWVLSI